MSVRRSPALPQPLLGTLDEVTSCAPSLGPGASQVVFPYRPHAGTGWLLAWLSPLFSLCDAVVTQRQLPTGRVWLRRHQWGRRPVVPTPAVVGLGLLCCHLKLSPV